MLRLERGDWLPCWKQFALQRREAECRSERRSLLAEFETPVRSASERQSVLPVWVREHSRRVEPPPLLTLRGNNRRRILASFRSLTKGRSGTVRTFRRRATRLVLRWGKQSHQPRRSTLMVAPDARVSQRGVAADRFVHCASTRDVECELAQGPASSGRAMAGREWPRGHLSPRDKDERSGLSGRGLQCNGL